MRYRSHPSVLTKTTNAIDNTFSYFRRRPIHSCGILVVVIWMIIAIRWTANRSISDSNDSITGSQSLSNNPIKEFVIESGKAVGADLQNQMEHNAQNRKSEGH